MSYWFVYCLFNVCIHIQNVFSTVQGVSANIAAEL